MANELDAYINAAKEAGCPMDQIGNFISAGYVALRPMLHFHAAARLIGRRTHGIREIMLDGTRGSAKSHAVIAQVGLDDCQVVAGLKYLFLRQTQRAAGESFEDLVGRVLRNQKHKANSQRVTFANGSRILIGGYKNDKDIDKYLGIEYDGLVIEEASQISGTKLEKLFGSVRTSRDNWVPRVYLTTNPGGIGHGFCKARYIEPQRRGRETFTRRFFSSYKDNPFINQEYRAYLEGLKGDLAKQWAEGDWDIFAGMVFSAWRHETHVIKPFEIPAHWIRLTGTDWGKSNPFCTLWAAKNPDNGRVVIYREVYETELTDPRQAELIKSMEDPGEKIRKRYADPSMWTKRTTTDNPTSTADVYRSHGIYLTPAVNDRINGKRKVDTLLQPMPDGMPGLLVFETCENLIRTLPTLVYDPTNTEDVNTEGEDHAYDSLRYLLTDDKPAKPQNKEPEPPNPWLSLKRM
jgi:PBSX family phage terminase large subunit